MENRRIIYDLGANNGDDIPYYLKKADLVVAVEANPRSCDEIRERFAGDVASGRLIVVNSVITEATDSTDFVDFYIHKKKGIWSQFPRPVNVENFDLVKLPALSVVDLVSNYGDPHYIKIDLEGYDYKILNDLFINNIYPPYISAESHDPRVFALFCNSGVYKAYKLVPGKLVDFQYRNFRFNTVDGQAVYSFPYHSAGPFGNDVKGEWLTSCEFIKLLGVEGLGWCDIHATRCDVTTSNSRITDYQLMMRLIDKPIRMRIASLLRLVRRVI